MTNFVEECLASQKNSIKATTEDIEYYSRIY